MENRINIAELLKDCPTGMELDCTTWENVTFEEVVNNGIYIKRNNKESLFDKIVILNQYGCITSYKDEKCRIFPKGKTTWEGFVPPCKFKDGDIVATNTSSWIGITTGGKSGRMMPTYCVINYNNKLNIYFNEKEFWAFDRLATEEEKQKLFDAIKANGYKWNAETKTLEKLIEPKFDITTLKPFNKVLVRDDSSGRWDITFYELYDNTNSCYSHRTLGGYVYKYCIPFEGNEHLLGKTDDCSEYYKTWE